MIYLQKLIFFYFYINFLQYDKISFYDFHLFSFYLNHIIKLMSIFNFQNLNSQMMNY